MQTTCSQMHPHHTCKQPTMGSNYSSKVSSTIKSICNVSLPSVQGLPINGY
jgi:hypothetical protein